MSNCSACGLPKSDPQDKCSYCGIAVNGAGQYVIAQSGTLYTLSAGGVVVGEAVPKEEVFQLRRPGRLSSENYLVPVEGTFQSCAAILNKALDSIAQINFEERYRDGASLAAYIDTKDRNTRLVLRKDGDHGVHIINPHGDIVLLASIDSERPELSIDLLVVRPESDLQPFGYFGIMVAVAQVAWHS